MIKKFCIWFCLFVPVALAPMVDTYAQKLDYVFTTQGDTLYGYISKIKLTSFKFKPNGRGKTEIFYSPQVKEFRVVDEVFETKELPQNGLPIFLERIETGSISIYKYGVYDQKNPILLSQPVNMFTPNGDFNPAAVNTHQFGNQRNINRLFACKNGGPLVEISATNDNITSGKQRSESFEELLSDDPELLQEYTSSSFFNFKSLRSYVKKYNSRASL